MIKEVGIIKDFEGIGEDEEPIVTDANVWFENDVPVIAEPYTHKYNCSTGEESVWFYNRTTDFKIEALF